MTPSTAESAYVLVEWSCSIDHGEVSMDEIYSLGSPVVSMLGVLVKETEDALVVASGWQVTEAGVMSFLGCHAIPRNAVTMLKRLDVVEPPPANPFAPHNRISDPDPGRN